MADSALRQTGGPEILAPVGDSFKLHTALAYGADAVYLAGHQFGLRQAADNFLNEELEEACRLIHSKGKKVYVTLNAFLFDHELRDLPDFLKFLVKLKVDAVIVSDLGVMKCVERHSDLNIHVSTQASCLNVESAKFWGQQGAKRIVLGREVSITEAHDIRGGSGMEVEVFVHGAMCMAYSGNCTISNYTAGRDSNRGGCVQSCRFSYSLGGCGSIPDQETTFLSSKDLRGIELLPEIMKTRIDSLKIEGRNKGPLYLATAVRNYSAAKRACQKEHNPDMTPFRQDLEKLSFRGYTQANLVAPATRDSVYHQDQAEPSLYQMIGHVVDRMENDFFAIQLRHNLAPDDTVEILGYEGDDLVLDVHDMRDASGKPISEGKPNEVLFFPDRKGVDKGMLLRKKTGIGVV